MQIRIVTVRRIPAVSRGPLIAGVVWLILFLLVHSLQTWSRDESTLCLVKRLTGVSCPACGGTRASLSLVSGRLLEALTHNPLVTCVEVGLVVWLAFRLILRKSVRLGLSRREAWIGGGVALLLLAVNWIYILMRETQLHSS